MNNPFKRIYQFNHDAGLLDQDYNDKKESAFQIEEALEGFNIRDMSRLYSVSPYAKDLSRAIIDETNLPKEGISDVDRLDKHLDSIVFALGSIYKLGLSPQAAMQALTVVAEANMQKLAVGTDSEGKQLKPADFVGPEVALQKILDRREF